VGASLADRALHAGCPGQARLERGVLGRLLRPGKKGGAAVGLTRKGKGTKWMLVVDDRGTPIGFHLESAQRAEIRLADHTLRSIRVPRRRGRPRTRPATLTADRGYDCRLFRERLRQRGIVPCIPEKHRPAHSRRRRGRPLKDRSAEYARRWIVERSFAWLGTFRRLVVRWEWHATIYQAFFTLALALLCLNRLLQS
jgi:transposase